jgi:polar amino acid transport system permease protein
MEAVAFVFHWDTFWNYLWPLTAFQNPLIANGIVVTIGMSITAQAIGVVLGLFAALGQMSRRRVIRAGVAVYITYFRGTPMLVQLALIYFGAASLGIYGFPTIHLGPVIIPGVIQAGALGLGINEGAFMAEIIRAGIISVDSGQVEAAHSIGMTHGQAMRWIVLPQAIRVIIPPLGNEFNSMIKATTLVVTIGGVELFNAYEQINGVIFQPFELFLAVSFYYLAMTMLWSAVQSRLERRYGHVAPRASSGIFRRMLSLRLR